ncbi:hypothetical protein DFR30_1310 [Thiogranum longum]|uniref:AMP nucleosidase n=1 Tax=Thiogranum longum TaxID=1537524 RepID=A0A4R1HBS2_9GAMM|nr:TIGR00730 family Rossman fold protein [Thiogranum longum]TCK18051.1 hypothetical protein DFR30_1310 [Thiogranum longum]
MSRKSHRPHIPSPANPKQRQEPLPWCHPKSPEEDPDAPGMVEAILNSPSYTPADRDLDFLQQDDTRSIRLQLDYLKPELLLRQHGVKHTVVVFGSTRIVEPIAAKQKVAALRSALADKPQDSELERRLAIAERIEDKSRYYSVAREFGSLVADASGCPGNPEFVVMTGGGPGIMEAANRGAYDAGLKTVGLNISLPHEQYPNPYITPELCFHFHYFALRKMHFLLRAKALVALPGGFGTFDELFETLTLIQTRKIKPVPVVLIGEQYWRRVLDIDFMVEEGVIDLEDRELFWYAETAQEAWDSIKSWHLSNNTPL